MGYMNAKGQAALEYLTSYGWALLAMLVTMGVLASFGVLSPSGALPEKCELSNDFRCVDFFISDNALVLGIDYDGRGISSMSNFEIELGDLELTSDDCELRYDSPDGEVVTFDGDNYEVSKAFDNLFLLCFSTYAEDDWPLPGMQVDSSVKFDFTPRGSEFERSSSGVVVAAVDSGAVPVSRGSSFIYDSNNPFGSRY